MISTAIQNRLKQAVAEKLFPGCVFGITTSSGERWIHSEGFVTDELALPMADDALFDVASLTKVIPTSSIALHYLDEGRIGIDDRVRHYLPELNHSTADAMTVRHLLTQTIDWGFALSSLKNSSPEQILHALYTRELASPPGSRFFYSNSTSILLGMVVERVGGASLDVLAQRHFFDPLGMRHSGFSPAMQRTRHIVPTEIDPWRGKIVVGEVHDESAWVLQKIMVPGSAGLFSTVPDLLIFLQMLLNNGIYGKQRYFSEHMIKAMATNQLDSARACTGLGWEYNQARYMGKYSSEVFGKTGFTGCVVMCNPTRGRALSLLSNFTYPHRKPSVEPMQALRRDLADIVFGDDFMDGKIR